MVMNLTEFSNNQKPNGFSLLGVQATWVNMLKMYGISTPTPVQQQGIPVALKGQDVIVQAQTGTGKTLAFLLPILHQVDPSRDHIQALIITPTRELALQITAELEKLLDYPECEIRVLAAYGGQDVERQMRKLQRSVHIVVATPGRLLDHMRRGTVNLGRLSTLVLDEADQMLHMGFLNEVADIISQTPSSRQTMLFSATMPQAVRELAAQFMKKPADVRVAAPQITVTGIKQRIIETTDRGKQEALIAAMEQQRPYLAVIFCRTKRRASALNEALQELGYMTDELHGDLSQQKREQVMQRFRDAKLQFLIATDVAARGLDVEGVTHVFNYDIPHDAESYVHRIGRTARAGGTGIAITFATPRDKMYVNLIEKGIRMTIDKQPAKKSAEELEFMKDERKQGGSRRDSSASARSGGRRDSSEKNGKGSRSNVRGTRKRDDRSSAGNRSRSNGNSSRRSDQQDQRGGRSGGRGAGQAAGASQSRSAGRSSGQQGRSGGRSQAARGRNANKR